jgi:excisionase family DNA binding protein
MHTDHFAIRPADPNNERADSDRSLSEQYRSGGANAGTDEEILTYREAAHLLKISARTLERWTREGLVAYIRLPQRGRWSCVRFSRNQLLRWLRQRTVRAR